MAEGAPGADGVPEDTPRSSSREQELDRALDQGGGELPPNRPLGILGGKGLDLLKADHEGPSIFGGVTQDLEPHVVWLAMMLAFLVFFPAAYVILWRTKHFSRRMKVGYTIGFTVVLAVVAAAVGLGYIHVTG